MNEKLEYVLKMYPDAKCELQYTDMFTLLVAVVLSAQTTDVKVNQVTPKLFAQYPTVFALAKAKQEDVENILKTLGMYKQKSKHIIELSQILVEKYEGEVLPNREILLTLPGVGNKTTNVVFAEGFKIPAFPVDTHIQRIAKRLQIAEIDDSVEVVEEKLKKAIPEELWIQMHHSLIFFGRYFCKAISPLCEQCKLAKECIKKYK